MSNESSGSDPMDFLKSMWNSMGFSLPGMVTPTLDADEISKRIADLKAVEGWLKMNLNTLQMTIQGLEMQRVALATLQAVSQSAMSQRESPAQAAHATAAAFNPANLDPQTLFEAALNPNLNPALNPALWPWNFMAEHGAEPGKPADAAQPEQPARARSARKKTSRS